MLVTIGEVAGVSVEYANMHFLKQDMVTIGGVCFVGGTPDRLPDLGPPETGHDARPRPYERLQGDRFSEEA